MTVVIAILRVYAIVVAIVFAILLWPLGLMALLGGLAWVVWMPRRRVRRPLGGANSARKWHDKA